MPPCTPERDRQLLSLMWNTANLNRFSVGPLRDAMLMKEDAAGSPPPSPQGLADCRTHGKVEGKRAPCFLAELLEAKATSDSRRPFLPGYSFISVSKYYLYFFSWIFFIFICLLKPFTGLKTNVQMYIHSIEYICVHTFMYTYICVYMHISA